MGNLFNFLIHSKNELSQESIKKGFTNFIDLANYVKNLPYGRNTDRSNYKLVLKENKGTCATKHAFLSKIALENNINNLHLYLGIYKMNASNTKGIEAVLKKYGLKYIPEAHCYLKNDDQILDFTRNEISDAAFELNLLHEEKILPQQIGDYKINRHQAYLKQWLKNMKVPDSFNEIWSIREACIKSLIQ